MGFEGHGDSVSMLIMEIIGLIIWFIGVVNLCSFLIPKTYAIPAVGTVSSSYDS